MIKQFEQQMKEIDAQVSMEILFDHTKANEWTENFHCTDSGFGKRLIEKYGHLLKYCYPYGTWSIYDGKRWTKDDRGEIYRMAKDVTLTIYRDAALITEESKRQAEMKFGLAYEAEAKRRAGITSAQSEPGVSILPEDFDKDPRLFNVLNGTIDLRTGQLFEHKKDHYITKLAPVFYSPQSSCPTWLAFLDRIMKGSSPLISFLQRAVGYSLTGLTSEQCLFFLYGLGANGKSTFIETLTAMMGDYAKQTATDTILIKRTGGGIPNDLAALKGARFVSAQEIESGRRMAESLVKQLTGQDKISARFLHGEFFEFSPQFKLWISGNSKPIIRGGDYAIWRRIRLIPFTVQIPPEDQDRQLLEKLIAELPGILSWAVEGCLKWQDEGRLIPPDEVISATEGYRDEMDLLGQFFSEKCQLDSNFYVSAKDIYSAYTEWSESQGEKRPMSQRDFGMQLTERGFEGKRHGKGRLWYGLKVSV